MEQANGASRWSNQASKGQEGFALHTFLQASKWSKGKLQTKPKF